MADDSLKRPNISAGETNVKKFKSSETHLLTLNDDCLFVIFNQLSLNDLCNVSRVCKRLKSLAETQFEWKYSEKWKQYEPYEKYSSLYTAKPSLGYVQCFEENIQNVVLKGSPFHSKQQTFECPIKCLEFACSQTNSGYKKIQFNSFAFYNKMDGDLCINNWKKVETVSFFRCEISEDFWNKMRFSDASCLKNLVFQSGHGFQTDGYDIPHLRTKWIASINIPKLEHFQYFCSTRAEFKVVHVQHLSSFLQRHPKLKSFAWEIDGFGFEDSVARQLGPIVKYGTALEQLFLKFQDPVDLEDVYSELKPLIERVNFKRLEIEHADGDLWVYPQKESKHKSTFPLTKLIGLHYRGFPMHLSEFAASLTNLKILHFICNEYSYDMTEIAQKLENLEELVFDDAEFDDSLIKRNTLLRESKSKITPFIRYSSKLKKVILCIRTSKNNKRDVWDENTIYDFNKYRMELKVSKHLEDASLEILFGGDYYSEDFINSLRISRDDFLVKMKKVVVMYPVLNIKSPLFNLTCECE